ncbi:MAG: 2-aminoethylphosphonate aminotransferase [Gammaproteobacteria bacterium]|nr:2-aminoethylphosphonate aminotransferase [Gammaproteobacteria bacterium]
MSERTLLLNPGPVTLSERVRRALVRGDWCHREPEFAALVRDIDARLAAVYEDLAGRYEAVVLTGSGTAAVEAMLASFAPEDRITLVVANGVYGERMARMLEAHRRPNRVLGHGWLEAVDLQRVEQALADDPAISHIAVVHHETTTGRLNDLAALARVAQARGVQLLLDGVSSFGAEQIAGHGWNLAAVAGTANKCLHGVAGLSFVLARRELWQRPPARPASVYFDLHAYHRTQHGEGFSPFTQAVQVAFALHEALAEHADAGGWLARRACYRERAARLSATLAALGVGTLLPPEAYSSILWSYRLPPGMSYAGLHAALKARGIVIYAGQGQLAADIFRIAHMGDLAAADLGRIEAALRAALGRGPA